MSDDENDNGIINNSDDEMEDDDLIGDNLMDAGGADEEYEAPDDDEDEYAAADEDEPREELPEEKAYVIHNRKYYYVPQSDGTTPGRVRDHHLPIWVANSAVLGSIGIAKAWPPAAEIPPMAVVVVKGSFGEEPASPDTKVGGWAWYCRVGIQNRKDGPDCTILRLMPKSVVAEFTKHLAHQSSMRTSSLLTTYQPDFDNCKALPVAVNGWTSVEGIKTEATPKPRAQTAKVKLSEDGVPVDHPSSPQPPAAPRKKSAAERSEAASSSGVVPEPALPKKKFDKSKSSRPDKMPMPPASKQGPMLAFTKQTKAKPPAAEPVSPAPSPAPPAAASPEPAPTPAPAPPPSAVASPARPAKRAAEDLADDDRKQLKRVRVLYCASKENTTTLWDGNKLYIIEA